MTKTSRAIPVIVILLSSACNFDWTVPDQPAAAGGADGSGGSGGVGGATGGDGGGPQGGHGGSMGDGGSGGGGGSGGADICTASANDNACVSCVKPVCCPQLQACEPDTQCSCLLACYVTPSSGCKAACGQPPMGTPGWNLGECAALNLCAACL